MTPGNRWLRIFLLALIGVAAGAAQGQEPQLPETVMTRERPELDPLGLQTGGYQIFPAIAMEAAYDDNIFAVNKGKDSDFITRILPMVDFNSDWTRNALDFAIDADIAQYRDNNDEDYQDYTIGVDGRFDIQRNDYLRGKAEYARKHVPRDSPNDSNGIEPTVFDVSSVSVDYQSSSGRFTFGLGGALDRRDYDDVPSRSGTINNDDQDRDELSAIAQVSYKLLSRYSAFVQVKYTEVNYDEKFDNDGLQRSSDGYSIKIGSQLPLTGVVFGEVFGGYLTRDYDDPALKNIDELAAGGELTWLPSGLTTVIFSISRRISESTVGTSSGILITEGIVEVDHELLRNLLLNASLSTRKDDFEGIQRDDDYLNASLGAKYLMNRYFYLALNYGFEDRDSNTPGGVNDFTNNILWLNIRGQL
jgi:hypothetical protein